MNSKLKIIIALLSISITSFVLYDFFGYYFHFQRGFNFIRLIIDLIVLGFLLSLFKSNYSEKQSLEKTDGSENWLRHFLIRFSILSLISGLIYLFTVISNGGYSEGYFIAILVFSLQIITALYLLIEGIILFRRKKYNSFIVNSCLLLFIYFIYTTYFSR